MYSLTSVGAVPEALRAAKPIQFWLVSLMGTAAVLVPDKYEKTPCSGKGNSKSSWFSTQQSSEKPLPVLSESCV